MAPHGSVENGLNWDDGNIPYQKLSAVLKEAVAGFAYVYSFGPAKCSFLTALLQRTVLDLEDFKCPRQRNSIRHTVAPCPVIDIRASVARVRARIPSMHG